MSAPPRSPAHSPRAPSAGAASAHVRSFTYRRTSRSRSRGFSRPLVCPTIDTPTERAESQNPGASGPGGEDAESMTSVSSEMPTSKVGDGKRRKHRRDDRGRREDGNKKKISDPEQNFVVQDKDEESASTHVQPSTTQFPATPSAGTALKTITPVQTSGLHTVNKSARPSVRAAEELPNHALQPARRAVANFGPVARYLTPATVIPPRIPQAPRKGSRTSVAASTPVKTPSVQNESVVQVPTCDDQLSALVKKPIEAPNSPVALPALSANSTGSSSSVSWPDLNKIKPIPPLLIARDRPEPVPHGELPETKRFSLDTPDWADIKAPIPEPYNAAYPHPLTAYASPGVNPHTLRASGYLPILKHMLIHEPDKVKGSILASSDRDVSAPALMIPTEPGEGLGIPERLWSRFESLGAARLPVGFGGVSPFTDSPHETSPSRVLLTPGFGPLPSITPTHASAFPPVPVTAHSLRHIASASDIPNTVRPSLARRHSDDRQLGLYPGLALQGAGGLKQGAFHKTELCPWFGEMGTCKYGVECQFAHGLAELRALGAPPAAGLEYETLTSLEHAVIPPSQGFSDIRGAPNSRLDIRRASCPPRELAPVEEADDDHDLIHPQIKSPALHPPIGAERRQGLPEFLTLPTIPRRTSSNPLISMFGMPTPPRSTIELPPISTQNLRFELPWVNQLTSGAEPMTPRPSDGSLSTSNSSRFALSTPNSATSPSRVDPSSYGTALQLGNPHNQSPSSRRASVVSSVGSSSSGKGTAIPTGQPPTSISPWIKLDGIPRGGLGGPKSSGVSSTWDWSSGKSIWR